VEYSVEPVILVEGVVKVVEVMEVAAMEKEVEVEVKIPCKFGFDSIDSNFW
jgi:hypothetical protein